MTRGKMWKIVFHSCRNDDLFKSCDRIRDSIAARVIKLGKDIIQNQDRVAELVVSN